MNKQNPGKWFLNACLNNEVFTCMGKGRWLPSSCYYTAFMWYFPFYKCTTVIKLTKRFQHFMWITLTNRLCIIIEYMRNLQTSAIDKFYFFAKQKERLWM